MDIWFLGQFDPLTGYMVHAENCQCTSVSESIFYLYLKKGGRDIKRCSHLPDMFMKVRDSAIF